ncbi:MAG: T9SS type A sorting domain-containing protein [Bacteroidota bacterium]
MGISKLFILPAAALILCCCTVFSQIECIWAEGLTGNGYDSGRSIWTDNSGAVYVAGNFQGTIDFDPGPDDFFMTNTISNDIYISKYSDLGDFLWARKISGTGNEMLLDISGDDEGNIYITGYFDGTVDIDPGAGQTDLTSIEGEDLFLAKYDSAGIFIWAFSLGGTGMQRGYRVIADHGPVVYLAGTFVSIVDFDPGPGTYNYHSQGVSDAFVGRYTRNGDFINMFNINGGDSDYIYGLDIDDQEHILTAGSMYDTYGGNQKQYYFILYDSAGVFINGYQMGGDGDETAFAASFDDSCNIYIAGTYQNSVDFDPGGYEEILNSNGLDDIFIAKYTPSCSFVWAKSVGGPGSDNVKSILVQDNGNIFASGNFYVSVDFNPGTGNYQLTSNGDRDIFMLMLENSGNFLSAVKVGGAQYDCVNKLISDTAGNFYLTGSFDDQVNFNPAYTPLTLTSTGNDDIFFSKYKINTTGIDNMEYSRGISIFPNPVSGEFSVYTDNEGWLLIYDLYGRICRKVYVPGESSTIIPVDGFDAGTYFVKFEGVSAGCSARLVVIPK